MKIKIFGHRKASISIVNIIDTSLKAKKEKFATAKLHKIKIA